VYIYTFVDADQPQKSQTAGNRWHAITIVGTTAACAAAEACRGKRFLSSEAPRLPLAECDAQRCECRFRHFADRRGSPRRRDENARAATARVVSDNRREKPGRRATD
jgi:hypothetical protein